MSNYLITPQEVIYYGPESSKLSSNVVRKQIAIEEPNFARKWLGWDFYELLIADAYDLNEVDEWVEGSSYAIDAIVQCNMQMYKSLTATNVGLITDTTKWQKISKMKTAAYATLYDSFLRNYLAFLITAQSVEYANAVGGKGLVDIDEDGLKTASIAKLDRRKSATLSSADDALDNLNYWVLEQKYGKGVTAYDKMLIISHCKRIIKPRPKRRRIATKRPPIGMYNEEYYLRSNVSTGTYTLQQFTQAFNNSQTATLEWDRNSGDLKGLADAGLVLVHKDGAILTITTDYTITDNTGNDYVVISDDTHVNGSDYLITAVKAV